MNYKIVLFLFLTSIYTGYAQRDKPKPEDISLAQSLKQKYEDEDAVITKMNVSVFFERNSKTNKIEVIQKKNITYIAISKIANIGFSTGYDQESYIEHLKLYNNRGKDIYWDLTDEAYSDASIFHNDYRVQYGAINLPSQGYTRTVKEKKVYKDIKYFTVHYFNNYYRTKEGVLKLHIPKWLKLDLKEFNFNEDDISKHSKTNDKGVQVLTYEFKNIPPIKKEINTPGNSLIYPHVVYLPKSYISKKGHEKPLFKETADLYAWYKSLVDAIDIDHSKIKLKVEELLKDKSTDEEKIKALYYWVQDNIKYIAFEDGIAGFKPDSPQNVFSKKYGDCKGMALLLKTMLKIAGFDARLVWIGTNSLVYNYSTPSLIVDNHMIAAIIKDGQPVFLDGTEKFNSYGNHATRIQGKQALVENGKEFILATVPKSEPTSNKEIYDIELEIKNESLIGNVKKTYSGEQVSQFLYGYNNTPIDKRENAIEYILSEGNANIKIKDINGFEPKKRDHQINISYQIDINNSVSSFDNSLYLEIDPVKYLYTATIKEKRENPFNVYHTKLEQKQIKLNIPSGYKIDTLPEPIFIENDLLSIEANYLSKGDRIIYNNKIILKKLIIQKDEFKDWNDAINNLKNFYDEQIVLTKK